MLLLAWEGWQKHNGKSLSPRISTWLLIHWKIIAIEINKEYNMRAGLVNHSNWNPQITEGVKSGITDSYVRKISSSSWVCLHHGDLTFPVVCELIKRTAGGREERKEEERLPESWILFICFLSVQRKQDMQLTFSLSLLLERSTTSIWNNLWWLRFCKWGKRGIKYHPKY